MGYRSEYAEIIAELNGERPKVKLLWFSLAGLLGLAVVAYLVFG
jgi:hypothetical protein